MMMDDFSILFLARVYLVVREAVRPGRETKRTKGAVWQGIIFFFCRLVLSIRPLQSRHGLLFAWRVHD